MKPLRTRVIPVLLLREESLVKTVRFDAFTYVGDPCNTVRIFNELEVDELMFVDITASRQGRGPHLPLLADIASECFMPLGYGGGIATLDQARAVFDLGFEKVLVNTHALHRPALITEIATQYGTQAVVVAIDVRHTRKHGSRVFTEDGSVQTSHDPVTWAREAEAHGAGEILLTAIDREGTWDGFDLELTRAVATAVSVPVIAHGGAGSVADIGRVVCDAGASAVALGSMVVFQKRGMGVLVNFPDPRELGQVLDASHVAGGA